MELTKALALHARVSPSRAVIPMLAGALVTIDGGIAAIQTTDIDQHLTTYHDVPDAPGAAPRIVDVRHLHAMIKAQPHAALGDIVASMPEICAAADWLHPPAHAEIGQVTMTAPAWRTMLEACASAMSSEETRYYLCGINLAVTGEAAATDGHRMVIYRAPQGAMALSEDVIIPTCAVDMLQRLMAKSADTRTLSVGDGRVRMDAPAYTYVSRIVEGTFPDYRRIVPTDTPTSITLPLDTLAAHATAIKRLYGRGSTPVLVLANDSVTAGAHAPAPLSLPLDGVTVGQYQPTGFNAGYVADLADAFPRGSTVTIAHHSKNDAALVTSASAPDVTMVLMPVRI